MTRHPISATLAWALVVLGLIVGYIGIANPLHEVFSQRASRMDLLAALVSDRLALIANGTALTDRREALRQRDGEEFGVIPARDTTAVARLQEYLRLAAAAQGLRVDTLRVLPDQTTPPFRQVAVRASLSGSIGQTQRLLHGLETGVPMIRVSHLNLLGRPGSPDLEITLEIAALAESQANAD